MIYEIVDFLAEIAARTLFHRLAVWVITGGILALLHWGLTWLIHWLLRRTSKNAS